MKKLQDAIDQVIDGLNIMKKYIADINQSSVLSTMNTVNSASIIQEEEDLGDFEQLKNALNSTRWPVAVNQNLICDLNSELDKTNRGKGIIELTLNNVENLKFLDYGCGEGYTIPYVNKIKKASKTIGFDINKYDNWNKFELDENGIITSDINIVQENGPYDIILLFDVLDHLKKENPEIILTKLRNLLSDDGLLYVRCHPYLSRHATHLYHHLNKAFAHLVFTKDELEILCPDLAYEEHNIGVLYPLTTYSKYFDTSKLKIVEKKESRENVESFFKIPKIAQRIMDNCKLSKFPEFQMGFTFIDYILKKG